MCFTTPKIPKPPPLPLPPNPKEADLVAEEKQARKAAMVIAPRRETVATSPLGDPGYGTSVNRVVLS
jgi:hypothetical protein